MQVSWAPRASKDLANICAHIEFDSEQAALRTVRAIVKGVSSLGGFPYKGRPGRLSGTRELPLTPLPYLAVYRVEGNVVQIARILHGAQRWPTVH